MLLGGMIGATTAWRIMQELLSQCTSSGPRTVTLPDLSAAVESS